MIQKLQETAPTHLATVQSAWNKAAKTVYPYWELDDQNRQTVQLLLWWIARNALFNAPQGANGVKLHLDKGIALVGPVGTGKTVLMRIMRQTLYLLQSPLQFRATDMRSMCRQYQMAAKAKDTEGASDPLLSLYKHLFVDEFGLPERERVQSYGNPVVMGDELITGRHNLFAQYPAFLTHITSNMTLEEMQAFYQPRTFDRIHEMFNIIPLTGQSRRKDAKPLPKVLDETTDPAVLETRKAEARQMYIDTLHRQFDAYKATKVLQLVFPVQVWRFLHKQGLITADAQHVAEIKQKAKEKVLSELRNQRIKSKNAYDIKTLSRTITRMEQQAYTEKDNLLLTTAGCELAIQHYYDSITELKLK